MEKRSLSRHDVGLRYHLPSPHHRHEQLPFTAHLDKSNPTGLHVLMQRHIHRSGFPNLLNNREWYRPVLPYGSPTITDLEALSHAIVSQAANAGIVNRKVWQAERIRHVLTVDHPMPTLTVTAPMRVWRPMVDLAGLGFMLAAIHTGILTRW